MEDTEENLGGYGGESWNNLQEKSFTLLQHIHDIGARARGEIDARLESLYRWRLHQVHGQRGHLRRGFPERHPDGEMDLALLRDRRQEHNRGGVGTR